MKVKVSKLYGEFVADPIEMPGSPIVGKGETLLEALGAFLINYQNQLGIAVEVDNTAAQAEIERRAALTKKR